MYPALPVKPVTPALPRKPLLPVNPDGTSAEIVNCLGEVPVFVANVMLLPATNLIVSRPCATNVPCPATSQYLKVEFIPILTAPAPKSVTSNPASLSNLIVSTLVITPETVLAVSIKLTVSLAELPV